MSIIQVCDITSKRLVDGPDGISYTQHFTIAHHVMFKSLPRVDDKIVIINQLSNKRNIYRVIEVEFIVFDQCENDFQCFKHQHINLWVIPE